MSKTYWGSGGSWDDVDESQTRFHTPLPGEAANGPRRVRWAFPDFTPRVHRGMDLLDEIAHGWPDEIDVTILDLDDGSKCILGQTWPHYARLLGIASSMLLPDLADGLVTAFDRMAYQLRSTDYATRITFAASIGCALGPDDVAHLNAMAKAYVVHKLGPTAHTAVGHTMMRKLADEIKSREFELLTETWLLEIGKARAAGRWDRKLIIPETAAADPVGDRARELLHV